MPDLIATRRDDRPTEGFTTTFLPSEPDRPVRLYLPSDYQPKYAYPLVVVFHGQGGDEDTAAQLIPGLSRRNYLAACPRGPAAAGFGPTGRPGFSWTDPASGTDEYLLEAVAHVRREYHVHSERVYLMGIGEGAAVAYRLGLAMAREVAGVVALNGRFPALASRPLVRLKAVRGLRVFVGHGTHNPVVPLSVGRKASRLLDSAGAEVYFAAYPTTHRVSSDMLRDVNRWIMSAVTVDEPAHLPSIG